MKARRLPADAARPVKDWLESQLAAHEPGVTTSMNVPGEWRVGDAPVVVVRSDGGHMNEWPVFSNDQVGVTVWATGRDESLRIAFKCIGWLLCLRVPGVGIRPGTGMSEARDPDNGGLMAGFTVRTRVRTTTF